MPDDEESKTPARPLPAGVSFTINEDGSVTFDGLPPELMDLALALDPDAVIACDLPRPRAEEQEQERRHKGEKG